MWEEKISYLEDCLIGKVQESRINKMRILVEIKDILRDKDKLIKELQEEIKSLKVNEWT